MPRWQLLVVDEIDLAPLIAGSLDVLDRGAKWMRAAKPSMFTNGKEGIGVEEVATFVVERGGLGGCRYRTGSGN